MTFHHVHGYHNAMNHSKNADWGIPKFFDQFSKVANSRFLGTFTTQEKGLDNIFLYIGKLSLGFRAFLALEHFLCPIKIGFGSAGTVTNFPFTLFTTVINCALRESNSN